MKNMKQIMGTSNFYFIHSISVRANCNDDIILQDMFGGFDC